MSLIPISETQLLFGYFHSYVNVHSPSHFLLPSIRQEGGLVEFDFPGADIVIEMSWLVQFKRPHFLKSQNIKEFDHFIRPHGFDHPYYRFYIKNDNPTNQLNKLIKATRSGFEATYISPLFNSEDDFFNLLKNDRLHLENYAHIDISQFDGMQRYIGRNNNHTILYTQHSIDNGHCYCFSEPKIIKAGNKKLTDHISKVEIGKKDIPKLIDTVKSIFFKKEERSLDSKNENILSKIQLKLLIEYNILWVIKWRVKENE